MIRISRQAAREQGLKRYFTGSPCPKGHIVERLVSSAGCIECVREKRSSHYYGNLEDQRSKSRRRMAALYLANPETYHRRSLARYAADPETWKLRVRDWEARNPEKVRGYKRLRDRRFVGG